MKLRPSRRWVVATSLFLSVAAVAAPQARAWLLQAAGEPKTEARPQAAAATADGREDDRALARAAMTSFAKAFEARDAKALASHWTSEGEFRNDAGVNVRGRDALEKAFADFFAKTPEIKAELDPRSLRFLSDAAAIDEGVVTVRRGAADTPARATYRALVVRDGERWRIAQLEESDEVETTIEDLGWLEGEWRSAVGESVEIRTTYTWATNRKFLHARFTIKEKDRVLSGTQVIGVDPATGEIHSWIFEADGGVGESDWSRDGDHWVVEAVGTLTDGSSLVETNTLRRVNEDTFTWQSVNRSLDEEPLPDLAPIKVTRVKPAK